jgi:hypothetical protein
MPRHLLPKIPASTRIGWRDRALPTVSPTTRSLDLHAEDSSQEVAAGAAPALPLLAAADLQDHLMVAGNDLDRLQRLLDHASEQLLSNFAQAGRDLDAGATDAARQSIGQAITALQFQDMASQLIAHTSRRLRSCADRIAREAMGDDDEDGPALVEDAPLRPNPVTQDEMDAGSVELF